MLPSFILWGLVGAVLAGICLGIMSVFVTQMKLSVLGVTMSHAAFAGAALGFLLGIDDIALAVIFALAVAAVLGPLADKAKTHAEVVTGAMFPLTVALAFLFLSLNPESVKGGGMIPLLWGSILALTPLKVMLLGLLSLGIVVLVFLFSKELRSILLHRKLAESSGIRTWVFYYLILFLAGAVAAINLKLLGGILIFVLLVTPAATVSQFSYDIKKILIVAPAVGAIFCLLGFMFSYLLDLPVGCMIALISSLTFIFSIFISPKRRRG